MKAVPPNSKARFPFSWLSIPSYFSYINPTNRGWKSWGAIHIIVVAYRFCVLFYFIFFCFLFFSFSFHLHFYFHSCSGERIKTLAIKAWKSFTIVKLKHEWNGTTGRGSLAPIRLAYRKIAPYPPYRTTQSTSFSPIHHPVCCSLLPFAITLMPVCNFGQTRICTHSLSLSFYINLSELYSLFISIL